ncbi:hypothetical protein [Aeromonas hydrophila]|uniref:hypothetical protein n=1 Tax=Aeromonas hydrophila TaxID=644 RepID=UPI00385D7516
MKKEKAAPHNGTTPSQLWDLTTKPTKGATKLELVALHLVENGTDGISSLSALAGLHDLNPRNSISDLRRHHGIAILDEYFSHQHSGDGVTHFKRYWVADRTQARKLVEVVNLKRKRRGAQPLSQGKVSSYIARFPYPTKTPAPNHQPAE